MKKRKEDFNYLNVYDKCYSRLDNKKCAKQRAKKGYCYRDIYSISDWFLHIIPKMLNELNNVRKGYPNQIYIEFYQNNKHKIPMTQNEFVYGGYDNKYKALFDDASNWCDKKWSEILNKMIFLFNECGENCTMTNDYACEYNQALKQFSEKYGNKGEKLMTQEEKEHIKGIKNCYVPHYMYELTEYKEIYNKYKEREKEIFEYKCKCQQKGLELFVKYFNELWW